MPSLRLCMHTCDLVHERLFLSSHPQAKIGELDNLLEAVGGELEAVVKEGQEIKIRRAEKTVEKKTVEREVKEVRVRQRRVKASIEEQSREKAALQQKMEDLVKM